MLDDLRAELTCEEDHIPGRCAELFVKWKRARKGKLTKDEVALTSQDHWPGDALTKAAEELRTQPEHVLKTVRRFKQDIEKKTLR